MMMMPPDVEQSRIIIGCDHRGSKIMNLIADRIKQYSQFDLAFAGDLEAETIDYPDIAAQVALEVSLGKVDYGILICGTGIGMCVVANKFPGVRAAPCHNEVVAELSRMHNNSNVLCLAGDTLGGRSSLSIVEKWLETPFSGGRHQLRLDKIGQIESGVSAEAFEANCCPKDIVGSVS